MTTGSATYAPLLLRLFTAFVLIYGTADNVFSHEHMLKFRDFLQQHRFPYPMASAYLSAYAQFICGILIGFGLFTRLASLLMIGNFLIALWMVHWGLPFGSNISALAMLVNAIYFAMAGAPRFSLDALWRARGHQRETSHLEAS